MEAVDPQRYSTSTADYSGPEPRGSEDSLQTLRIQTLLYPDEVESNNGMCFRMLDLASALFFSPTSRSSLVASKHT